MLVKQSVLTYLLAPPCNTCCCSRAMHQCAPSCSQRKDRSRCCRETAHVQKQLETRYAPLRGGLDGATQWHHNSHMADPPALAQGLAQSSRSLW